jgi:hypothetical protein
MWVSTINLSLSLYYIHVYKIIILIPDLVRTEEGSIDKPSATQLASPSGSEIHQDMKFGCTSKFCCACFDLFDFQQKYLMRRKGPTST